MKLGPCRLGEPLIRRVADQQMTEAEAVFAWKLRLLRPDELLANERGEPGSDVTVVGSKRPDGAAVEPFSLDGSSLEHPPLRRLEFVEPRGKERPQRRRNCHLALRLVGDGQHLRDEQRIAARRSGDPLAQLVRHALPDQLVDMLAREQLQPKRDWPRRAALEDLRSRHAEDEER